MKYSDSITKIAIALVKAQKEIENVNPTSRNPFIGNKYADLASIINEVKPALMANGISLIQIPSFDGQIASVETILLHESGEWISGISSSPLQPGKDGKTKHDPQGIGSATTYLRRYAMAAMCFLAQEDDDGNNASGRKGQGQRQGQGQGKGAPGGAQQPPKEPPATKVQIKKILDRFDPGENEAGIVEYVWRLLNAAKPIPKFTKLSDMTSRMADFALVQIDAEVKAAQESEKQQEQGV